MEDEKNNSPENSKKNSLLKESFNQLTKEAENQVGESIQKSQRSVPETSKGLINAVTEIISNSNIDPAKTISEKL
jgi:hypothetical protein